MSKCECILLQYVICFCCTAAEGFSQEEEEKGLNEMKIELDEVSNGWLTTENADRRKIKVENQETLSIGDLSLGAQYFGMNLVVFLVRHVTLLSKGIGIRILYHAYD